MHPGARIDKRKVKKQMRKVGIRRIGELAGRIGVSPQAVSRWFAGEPFASGSLGALCAALECTPNDVLVWAKEEDAA